MSKSNIFWFQILGNQNKFVYEVTLKRQKHKISIRGYLSKKCRRIPIIGVSNHHSQAWFSKDDYNAEGADLNNFFSVLNLQQLIEEPTHFFNSVSKPSCIDIILTDQPNLVLSCGVRPSLDPLVHHQMTFCKINFKIPPPKYERKI